VGSQQVINAFIAYADPLATQIEAKISNVVSPQTYYEYMKKTEKTEEAETEDNVG